jgi:hypothetical protein
MEVVLLGRVILGHAVVTLIDLRKDLVRELACGTSGLQVARAPSIAICPMR